MQFPLTALARNISRTLDRIWPSHLDRYVYLQDELHGKDVRKNLGYQTCFKGFYRMGRRPQNWYVCYFDLLEQHKRDPRITFTEILEAIYAAQQRIEPSFSSKLLATIRPEKPVYDRYVVRNLALKAPSPWAVAPKRMEQALAAYEQLEDMVNKMLEDPIFPTLIQHFDDRFPKHANISDVKKLDLLLWQHRTAARE